MSCRLVHPDSPGVGDKVRASFEALDVRFTHEGVIQDIRCVSGGREYLTGEGVVIYRTFAKRLSVEMIKAYTPASTPIFDI